jgi:hypothetical protein
VSTGPTRPRPAEPPPGVVARAEQGYHGFLGALDEVTAEARAPIADLGPLRAFACLTAQLRRADPEARAGFAAIAVIALAQRTNDTRN